MTTDLFTSCCVSPSDCKQPSLLPFIKRTSISYLRHIRWKTLTVYTNSFKGRISRRTKSYMTKHGISFFCFFKVYVMIKTAICHQRFIQRLKSLYKVSLKAEGQHIQHKWLFQQECAETDGSFKSRLTTVYRNFPIRIR